MHPRIRMTEAFYEHAPLHDRMTARLAPDAAVNAVRAAFRGRRYRTAVEQDGEAVHVYGDRFRWAPFGTVMAHLSLVVILIGAVAGITWGFRNESFAVPVGSTMDVGNGTGLAAKAVTFHDSYYASGAPSDYATDLVIYRDGVPVKRQMVRVNSPLRYDGVSFYQSFFGAAAVMRVKGPDGAVLFNQGVPLLWGTNDDRRRVGRFVMPERGMTALVVSAASGEVDPAIKAGQMQVEIYRDGIQAPVATKVVSQGRPATIAGLEVTFLRERQFTGLIVAHDPGAILIWIGVGLLVGGIVFVFFFQNRRVWVRVAPARGGSDIRVGAAPRRDLALGPDFQHLVDDMKLAVTRRASAT
jgi:cytochrome c biogenesis protein